MRSRCSATAQAEVKRGMRLPKRDVSFGVVTTVSVQMSSAPAEEKIARAWSLLSGFSVWIERLNETGDAS